MSAIGPGDWVECIKSDGEFGLEIGTIWCVARIVHGVAVGCSADPHCLEPIVELVGVPVDPIVGPCGCGFRPIYRPDETLTARLMEPLSDALAPTLPERVSEPATAR